MTSAAAAAEDYGPTTQDCVLRGREARRAGQHFPMVAYHALQKLNCLIKRASHRLPFRQATAK